MLNIQLARKYARAIFEIAEEEKKLEKYGDELASINKDLFSNDQAVAFFSNPQIDAKSKKELLTKCFKGEVSETIMNFLLLLVDKRRIGIFSAIESEFRALSNEARGILIADVISVGALTKTQQTQLQKKLSTLTGKKIQLRLHHDKKILGGLIVTIGDKRIDGSVAGRLQGLKSSMVVNA